MEQIVYGQPLLPRAVSVEAMSDFMLKIRFTNNEERFFDVKKIYHLPCFAPLRNKEFFKTVPIEYGSVAWSDGIDYCPDCLYEESVQAASLLEADEQILYFQKSTPSSSPPASTIIRKPSVQ